MKRPRIYNWDKLPLMMTVKDVVLVFDCSEVTVKTWAKRGVLPGYKVGGKWYFNRDEIRRRTETWRGTDVQTVKRRA